MTRCLHNISKSYYTLQSKRCDMTMTELCQHLIYSFITKKSFNIYSGTLRLCATNHDVDTIVPNYFGIL